MSQISRWVIRWPFYAFAVVGARYFYLQLLIALLTPSSEAIQQALDHFIALVPGLLFSSTLSFFFVEIALGYALVPVLGGNWLGDRWERQVCQGCVFALLLSGSLYLEAILLFPPIFTMFVLGELVVERVIDREPLDAKVREMTVPSWPDKETVRSKHIDGTWVVNALLLYMLPVLAALVVSGFSRVIELTEGAVVGWILSLGLAFYSHNHGVVDSDTPALAIFRASLFALPSCYLLMENLFNLPFVLPTILALFSTHIVVASVLHRNREYSPALLVHVRAIARVALVSGSGMAVMMIVSYILWLVERMFEAMTQPAVPWLRQAYGYVPPPSMNSYLSLFPLLLGLVLLIEYCGVYYSFGSVARLAMNKQLDARAVVKHFGLRWVLSCTYSIIVVALYMPQLSQTSLETPFTAFCLLSLLNVGILSVVKIGKRSQSDYSVHGKLNAPPYEPQHIRLSANALTVPILAFASLKSLGLFSYLYAGFVINSILLFALLMWAIIGAVIGVTLGTALVTGIAGDMKTKGSSIIIAGILSDSLAMTVTVELTYLRTMIPLWAAIAASIAVGTVIYILTTKTNEPRLCLRLMRYRLPWSRVEKTAKSMVKLGLVGLILLGSIWYGGGIVDSLGHEPSDIRVAVVDTGITKDHPLLSTHVVQEHSFVTIENGFEEADPSTADSKITGHGTFVARQILEVFPQASIINAKVLTLDDNGDTSTTYDAVAAAINWSADVADADVINLSLGGIFWDSGVMKSVYHAWSQGVLVVCAAGNEQLDYTGNSVSYPSAYVPAISVAAMNPDGTLADYSSWGPASGRYMKPDIAAPAVFLDDQRSRGTSLATPWVSGAAAKIIALCDDLGVAWTPGMLKAALLRGASWSLYEDYQVGCGILDIDESIWLVRQAEVIDGVPFVCCISPSSLPLEFDRVFVGCPYQFHLTVTCSIESEYMVHVKGNAPSTLNVTGRFIANQSALYEVKILVPENSSSTSYDFDLLFEAHGQNRTVSVEFDTLKPRAKIALDMCHRNPHTRQSIYGDYLHYYSWLTSELIAVSEIRDRAEFDSVHLEQFDALFLLDTWINNDTYYSPDEVVAIENYYKQGGSVFIGPAYSGKYQNTTLLNSVVNWTGAFYDVNGTRGNWNVTSNHEVVYGLHPDYQSGLFIHANTSFITLGGESHLESGNALLVYRETPSRLMIAGFGGMFGSYEFTRSTDLCQLAKRMTLWLCRLF